MELRHRNIVRIDHAGSRLHHHLPAFLRTGLAGELGDAFKRRTAKLDFMRFMDSFQLRLYEQLLDEYGDEPFCRLFAVKLCNLAVSKYHFLHRHSVLMSRPFQLTVDPTNACQLACPGCVHSSNAAYANVFDWPRSTLPVHVFKSFLEEAGASGFCAMLYNYGEPLLNKRFTDFVRFAKKYLLFTMTSTNLSMPLDDPDSIVESGLDRMVLSIDGTTQETYERYRRKGRLDLVLENIRKIVASKKKRGSNTPYLIWQFLTFEHNAHQIGEAIEKAQGLGVNEIALQTPFGVELDDPTIRPVQAPGRGNHIFVRWDGSWCTAERRNAVAEVESAVRAMFDYGWEKRFINTPSAEEEARPGTGTCDWLYHNVTLDGAARLMPCCMSPDKGDKHLVFDNFGSGSAEIVNSPMARLARLAFSDRAAYEEQTRNLPSQNKPYCASCAERPAPYGLANVGGDITALDGRRAVPHSLKWALTDWNRS